MPTCHTCEFDGKGDDACLRCRGPAEPSHKGRTHISIDAGQDEAGQSLGECAASVDAIPLHDDDAGSEQLDELRPLLCWMLSLRHDDLLVLQARIAEPSVPKAEIARRVGGTIAGVTSSFNRLRAALPAGASPYTVRLFQAHVRPGKKMTTPNSQGG